MLKSIFTAAILLTAVAAPAAELTAQETHWLQAAAPVLAYAKQLALPIDIVVQPKAGPGDVPMAMGYDGKRCKLVLSMRGRMDGDADAILAGLPAGQQALMIEAMAAHEIGHCWRYANGVWHALPAGFVDRDGAAGAGANANAGETGLAALRREMREMRREEGFSDLVALAWTARRHPQQYQSVLAWLQAVRLAQPTPRGGHDTLGWVRLAHNPAVFAADGTPFEAVDALWTEGLLRED
ncbi:MAG: hypothetical protein JWP59_4318 [Massilia sp.]|nr:hypothetical protein [Massilia sp.]